MIGVIFDLSAFLLCSVCLPFGVSQIRYSIKLASKHSGVSSHLIRMWEKRYGALSPDRTASNRRLYTDENIERLSLLFCCTQAGHRISNVASLPTETLRELAVVPENTGSIRQSEPAGESSDTEENGLPAEIRDAFAAIKAMDVEMLRGVLDQATVTHGHQGMLTKIAVPLMQHIGRLWSQGELPASYEHFASAALQTYLLGQLNSYSPSRSAPVIITVTPSGQLHEMGAVVTAAAANSAGWNVIHLGPSLPAAEIVGAAIRTKAKMVALSLVHPPDDPELPTQLRLLRRLLPSEVGIVAGGRASPSYHDTLEEIQAEITTDLGDLYEVLAAVRQKSI